VLSCRLILFGRGDGELGAWPLAGTGLVGVMAGSLELEAAGALMLTLGSVVGVFAAVWVNEF
jgi:hypothetical protein